MRNPTAVLLLLMLSAACDRGVDGPPAVVGVSYVGMSVSDLDAARQFYSSAAGMEEVDAAPWSASPAMDELTGSQGATAETVLLRSTNAQLRLMEFANPSAAAAAAGEVPVYGPGIAHVCFQAAVETETYQKFRANGATPEGAPDLVQINPKNPVWYAYSRDPDGMMFEVEHLDLAQIDLPQPPKYDRRIRHVSIGTPDIKQSVRFYQRLLDYPKPRRVGWWLGGISGETIDQVAGLDGVKLAMAWFQVGNLELEIIQYKSHPTEPPAVPRPPDALGYNMIVFDVVDIETVKAKLVEAGGSVVTDVENRDGGELFFGRDPDGNLLGFLSGGPGSPYSAAIFNDSGV